MMLILSIPCSLCTKYYKQRGSNPIKKNLYLEQKLPNGKSRHTTRFGRAFHGMALKNLNNGE